MPYVAPSDEEITYSAQVIVHADRGGPQVVFPKADDSEVKKKIEELKEEREKKINAAKESGESVLHTGLHVPKAESETGVGGNPIGEVNKNATTPGAPNLVSDNTNQVRTSPESAAEGVNKDKTGEVNQKVDSISGEPIGKDDDDLTKKVKDAVKNIH